MGDDAVQNGPRLDLAGPADEAWHAPTALPVGVFLTAERRIRAVGPSVVLGTVIGRIHDDGVVGNTQLIEFVEHLANLLVVHNHAIAIGVLAALAEVFLGYV